MASSSPVNADELAQLTLGKPFLLGQNILRSPLAAPQWRTGGSWLAGADITEAAFPTTRLYDEHAGLYTRPNTAAIATVYLIFDLNTVSPQLGFDTLVMDLDIKDCGDQIRLLVELADVGDSGFGTPVPVTANTLITGTAGSGDNYGNFKWVVPNLLLNHAYNGYRYMRIRFQRNAGVSNFLTWPRVGEIYCGLRRQLSHFPMMPHDDQRRESSVADFVAYSGRRHRIVRAKGSQPFPAQFTINDGAGLSNVNDLAQIRAWFNDIDQGVKPFYYCDQPLATPKRALFLDLPDPALDIPREGYANRTIDFSAREMPPYRTLEIAG